MMTQRQNDYLCSETLLGSFHCLSYKFSYQFVNEDYYFGHTRSKITGTIAVLRKHSSLYVEKVKK